MAKKRELITKGSAIRRFNVASEIPPFGPELVVRQMILRQSYRMAGQGDGPPLLIRILGPGPSNGQNNQAWNHPFHASILTASIIFRREAWVAGKRLARTAAGNNQIGVHSN